MFVKNLYGCNEFTANDGCGIRELLHPEKDGVDLPYSLALARVKPGRATYRHRLEQTEVYYLLRGAGRMIIDNEIRDVTSGDIIVIPARAVQHIENTGRETLEFAAIVSPPWTKKGDIRVD